MCLCTTYRLHSPLAPPQLHSHAFRFPSQGKLTAAERETLNGLSRHESSAAFSELDRVCTALGRHPRYAEILLHQLQDIAAKWAPLPPQPAEAVPLPAFSLPEF